MLHHQCGPSPLPYKETRSFVREDEGSAEICDEFDRYIPAVKIRIELYFGRFSSRQWSCLICIELNSRRCSTISTFNYESPWRKFQKIRPREGFQEDLPNSLKDRDSLQSLQVCYFIKSGRVHPYSQFQGVAQTGISRSHQWFHLLEVQETRLYKED